MENLKFNIKTFYINSKNDNFNGSYFLNWKKNNLKFKENNKASMLYP